MPAGKLTRRQQLFAHEYLVDLNATRAAIRCGYSEKSARVTAARMLANANIHQYVENAWRDKIRRADLTTDDVLRLISRAAFARLDDFVDWGPREESADSGVRIKSPDEIGADTDLLTEISEEVRDLPNGVRERSRKVKLVSKEQMIKLLAAHYGIGNDINVNLKTSLPDILKRSAELANKVDVEADES